MDFQIREPLHPLFGALNKTNVLMETQVAPRERLTAVALRSHCGRTTVTLQSRRGRHTITMVTLEYVLMSSQAAQEYTGQQIHPTNLVGMWSEYLAHDTLRKGPGTTIASLLTDRKLSGMACVGESTHQYSSSRISTRHQAGFR